MSKSFLKRLSSCFHRRNTRNFRGSSRSSLVQILEPRHLLTAPTLDTLYDVTLAEDAAEKSVPLTGITDGDGGIQPLRVTALSGNTSLIAAPSIDYTSPDSTGTLRFTPVADKAGLTTITVTVEDGGADRDLSTATDNEKFIRSFNVTVTPVNDAPTMTAPASFTVTEDVAGNLVWPASPAAFADVDSPALTVTLAVADGTLTAAAAQGITLGGTATARTITGSPADLN
ncbi:MAG: hypothetical protein WCK86_08445, partial [Planctomycetia bacterium]